MIKQLYFTSYIKGMIAELYVFMFLVAKGYKPVKWRMRNHVSEIDLIMTKKNALIAIEVKYRQKSDDALYAVSYSQQQKIRDAFHLFSGRYQGHYQIVRCDVCVVSGMGRILHLKNAF